MTQIINFLVQVQVVCFKSFSSFHFCLLNFLLFKFISINIINQDLQRSNVWLKETQGWCGDLRDITYSQAFSSTMNLIINDFYPSWTIESQRELRRPRNFALWQLINRRLAVFV